MATIHEKMTAIGDAIRAKTGGTELLTLDDMATEIADISTGVELNYEVVGGTSAPSSSKENTIWVDTSTAIHAHSFSATEPIRISNNKNLIVYPFKNTNRTENGITWTDNGDGTITANGTTTDNSYFWISHSANTIDTYETRLKPGIYFLHGSPEGSGGQTYRLRAYVNYDNWTTTGTAYNDNGDGCIITVTQEARVRFWIAIASGITVSNITFRPQLELGSSATSFVKGDATGQVWFKTGEASPTEFNALKDNGIQVYPLSAKQYISGEWVSKTAKTYQNSTWKDWVIYLYNTGDTCESVHGGWTTSTRWYQTNPKTPVIRYHDDSIEAYVTASGLNFQSGIMETVNGVDITNFSKLTFVVKSVATSGGTLGDGWARLALGVTPNLTGTVTAAVEQDITAQGTYTLDISSLKGVHDIIVKVQSTGANGIWTQIIISQIYLSN